MNPVGHAYLKENLVKILIVCVKLVVVTMFCVVLANTVAMKVVASVLHSEAPVLT